MDIELLFSSHPFVRQKSDGFSIVRPNLTQTVSLPADKEEISWELPVQVRDANIVVEVVHAGQTKSRPYLAHALALSLNENYGQLQVLRATDRRPLAKVYVKVYAQKPDGSVVFYKDGYTDMRGRFDYVSLSNQPLDDVRKFALLVLSDEFGAVVREAQPPKE
jgi:hypothetical protein